jgi:tetratricopeptide (TPR) repeat protein
VSLYPRIGLAAVTDDDNEWVSSTNADLLARVSLPELGTRLRAARVAAGLTQVQLARDIIEPSYVCRVEGGHRRPNLRVLTTLAERVGAPLEELLTGMTRDRRAAIQSRIDFAELSLSSEDPSEALAVADEVLAELVGMNAPDLSEGALRLRASAREASGDLDGAAADLMALTAGPVADVAWVKDLISLSRCLRESGRLDEAIAVDVAHRAQVERLGLAETTEAVQLTITTSAALVFRGDLGRALRICKRAAADAVRYGLPVAQASALWNASAVLQLRGRSAQDALTMALQALALFEESGDTRNLGRLRIHVANVQLSLRPPDAAGALEMLQRARQEVDWSTASALDAARVRLGMAISHELLGQYPEAAIELEASVTVSPVNAAELLAFQAALRGRLAAAEGDLDAARQHYREGIATLTGSGADRDAAQLWYELGEIYRGLGDSEPAADAFRRAGAAQGLRSTP